MRRLYSEITLSSRFTEIAPEGSTVATTEQRTAAIHMHGDPISNFTVLVTNLAQGPSLGEGERWSQIRLQQSLLEFNGVVILILFDFLIEVQ